MKNWFGRVYRSRFSKIALGLLIALVVSSVVAPAWMLPQSLPSFLLRKSAPPVPFKPAPKARKFYKPVEVLPENAWADSTLRTMTLDEKIGQFFMVATFSNRNEAYYQSVDRLIQDYRLGGLIFFQGGPYRQAVLTNRWQAKSKVPLFIGIDGEWGLGMRLDSTMSFPKQMVLGAIRNDSLIYRMGDEIGQHCRRLGIHINFAPVSVTHSSEQLRDIDLYPYRRLIADSLMGVLTGHLYVPVLDNTPQLATSLSEKVVTGLLRNQMGFRGLVFTDAMNMKGVLKTGKAADVNLKALMAGNDILLYPESVAETIRRIKEAVAQGTITEKFIDEKAGRILKGKYWAGLSKYGDGGAQRRQPDSLWLAGNCQSSLGDHRRGNGYRFSENDDPLCAGSSFYF